MTRTTTRKQDQTLIGPKPFFTLAFMEKELLDKLDLAKFNAFINASIDLPKFGEVVKYVGYAPVILKNKRPEDLDHNKFLPEQKRLFLSIELDYKTALPLNQIDLVKYVIDGLSISLKRPNQIKGFDFNHFKNQLLFQIEAYKARLS